MLSETRVRVTRSTAARRPPMPVLRTEAHLHLQGLNFRLKGSGDTSDRLLMAVDARAGNGQSWVVNPRQNTWLVNDFQAQAWEKGCSPSPCDLGLRV